MNIEDVTPVHSWIIETDDEDFPTWRVSENGNWENLMSMSWETEEPPEELVEKFKQWHFNFYGESFG